MAPLSPARAKALLAAAGLLLAWELGAASVDDPRALLIFPRPSGVFLAAARAIADGSLPTAALRSTARVSLALGIAVGIGVPLGIAIGRGATVLEGPLALLRPVPPVAWVPLTLVWFGVGELQQVVVVAGAATLVLVGAVAEAVRRVDPRVAIAALNLGAPAATLPWRVLLPAAGEGIRAGLREATATAWFVLVAAELLSGERGLGVLILQGRDALEPERCFVGMVAIAACGAATDALWDRLGAQKRPPAALRDEAR